MSLVTVQTSVEQFLRARLCEDCDENQHFIQFSTIFLFFILFDHKPVFLAVTFHNFFGKKCRYCFLEHIFQIKSNKSWKSCASTGPPKYNGYSVTWMTELSRVAGAWRIWSWWILQMYFITALVVTVTKIHHSFAAEDSNFRGCWRTCKDPMKIFRMKNLIKWKASCERKYQRNGRFWWSSDRDETL